jgi:hypothetical protein
MMELVIQRKPIYKYWVGVNVAFSLFYEVIVTGWWKC